MEEILLDRPPPPSHLLAPSSSTVRAEREAEKKARSFGSVRAKKGRKIGFQKKFFQGKSTTARKKGEGEKKRGKAAAARKGGREGGVSSSSSSSSSSSFRSSSLSCLLLQSLSLSSSPPLRSPYFFSFPSYGTPKIFPSSLFGVWVLLSPPPPPPPRFPPPSSEPEIASFAVAARRRRRREEEEGETFSEHLMRKGRKEGRGRYRRFERREFRPFPPPPPLRGNVSLEEGSKRRLRTVVATAREKRKGEEGEKDKPIANAASPSSFFTEISP